MYHVLTHYMHSYSIPCKSYKLQKYQYRSQFCVMLLLDCCDVT